MRESLKPIWLRIPCPKQRRDISWEECLSCSDNDKNPDCPIWVIRKSFEPYGRYKLNRYHCTETFDIRKAWFTRNRDWTAGWFGGSSIFNLFIGSAMHMYVQKNFPKQWTEIHVEKSYKDKEFGDFKITGSIDTIDYQLGILYEFKSAQSLKWILKKGPSEVHQWQIKTYYELLEATDREAWENLKEARIVYVAKTLYSPKPYKEYIFTNLKNPNPDVFGPLEFNPELEGNARALHKALHTKVPPLPLCHGIVKPDSNAYPCKYCPAWRECRKWWVKQRSASVAKK